MDPDIDPEVFNRPSILQVELLLEARNRAEFKVVGNDREFNFYGPLWSKSNAEIDLYMQHIGFYVNHADIELIREHNRTFHDAVSTLKSLIAK